jgi:hypothetical protein
MPKELSEVKNILESAKSVDRIYTVKIADKDGVIHATVEKNYILRKREIINK